MNIILFNYNWEWAILDFFNKWKNPFLDYLSLFLSKIISGPVILFILLIVFYLVDKNKGKKIGLITSTVILYNNSIKSIMKVSRPFTYPDKAYLRKLDVSMDNATGHSFPSGHSQTTGTIGTVLFLNFRNKIINIISIILMILIPLSRLYLGVHFFSDVVIGLLLGIVFTLILNFLYQRITNINYLYLFFFLLVMINLPILIININDPLCADLFKSTAFTLALIISFYIEGKYINLTEEVPFKQKIIRLIITSVLTLLIYSIKWLLPKHNIISFFNYLTTILTAFLLSPLIIKKMEGKKHEH